MRAPRPASLAGQEAGRQRLGGWISPNGEFYPADHYEHLRVAQQLRATGDGPKDPWDVNDPWLMVKSHGEVLFSVYLTQAQVDTVGDMLLAAPNSTYRSLLLGSLRSLQELEHMSVRRVVVHG